MGIRLLPHLPVATWDFDLNAVPGSSGEAESGLVVARPDFPSLFILNNSARFIWKCLQIGGSVEALVECFAEHFAISLAQASADISSTIAVWSEGLLSPIRATEPVTAPPVPPPSSSNSSNVDYKLASKHFRLIIHDRDFLDEIVPRLTHLTTSQQTPDFTFQVFSHKGLFWVFCGGAAIGAEREVSVARTILLQEMARLVRPGTDWLAIVHAAACGTVNRSVILPAPTNSGKSTLTAALMHSGLQVFSDDSAAIDRQTGQVVSLPFGLMLREGSWPILAPYFPELNSTPVLSRNGDYVRFLPPSKDAAHSAVPIGLLFVQFQTGIPAQLQPLTTFESLLALQKSGFWVPHNRENIAQFLSWVQSLPAYTLTYSDLSEAVSLVCQFLRD